MSRYNNREAAVNSNKLYEKIFEKKEINKIYQYKTPILDYPNIKQDALISTRKHVWTYMDKFYKLANQHYGDHTLWWVIAQYNRRPTEAHFNVGDVVLIPYPLSIVLKYVR